MLCVILRIFEFGLFVIAYVSSITHIAIETALVGVYVRRDFRPLVFEEIIL